MNDRELELKVQDYGDKKEEAAQTKEDVVHEVAFINQTRWERLGGRDDDRDNTAG